MNYARYITDHLDKPFEWGKHDCITFAVGWLSRRAGVEWFPGAPAPVWSNAIEARRAVLDAGGLQIAFDAALKRIDVAAAQDGDVTLIGRTVYLFTGRHIVAPGPNGLVFIDRTQAPCAWSL
jgi:hypothetical protein